MKKRKTGNPANQQIIDEAATWFVEFRTGDIDTHTRKEFHEWLRRSPDHIQAYLDIAATYAELPAPNPSGELNVQAMIDTARSSPDPNVIDLGLGPRASALRPDHSALRTKYLAIAATVVMTIAVASWLYIQRDTYSTDIGEQRSLTLADGSTVELNSRTRIRIRYDDNERRIDLLDGQALFHVAKNPRRPFIVHVNDTQVRAVGTQFDVYRKPSGTIVTVVEGKVAVVVPDTARPSGQAPNLETPVITDPAANARVTSMPTIFLAAGEQVTIAQTRYIKAGAPSPDGKAVSGTVVAATAWTQRQLIFENASLNEVAEEFNRYSTRPIIMETGDYDPFHISGTYSSTNPEALIRFLRLQPGIKLVESDREIRITRE